MYRVRSHKTRFMAVILALVLVLAGLSSAFAQTPQTITLQMGQQNGSGQTGTATLTDLGNGTTKVVINITSGGAGVTQPAHIHDGSCGTADLKGVKYPLTSVTNGTSETTVNVKLSDLLASPMAINVHKSVSEANVYTSCANIVANSTSSGGQGGGNPSSLPASGAGGAATPDNNGTFGLISLVTALVVVMGFSFIALRRRTTRR